MQTRDLRPVFIGAGVVGQVQQCGAPGLGAPFGEIDFLAVGEGGEGGREQFN